MEVALRIPDEDGALSSGPTQVLLEVPARPRKTADGALWWPTEPEGRAIGAALLQPLPKLELPPRGRANPCSKACARRTSTSAANGSGPVTSWESCSSTSSLGARCGLTAGWPAGERRSTGKVCVPGLCAEVSGLSSQSVAARPAHWAANAHYIFVRSAVGVSCGSGLPPRKGARALPTAHRQGVRAEAEGHS